MDIANGVQSLLGFLKTLEGSFVLAAVGSAALVYYRTGSWHIILDRFWRWIFKGEKTKDAKLKRFSQDVAEVNQFVFLYRLKAGTKEEMHRWIDWIQQNKLDPTLVANAQGSIDLDRPDPVLKPSWKLMAGWLAFTVFCEALTLIFCAGAFSESMLVSVNKTGDYYWVAPEEARRLGRKEVVRFDHCEKLTSPTAIPEIHADDIAALCSLASNKDLTKQVRDTVLVQRFIFIPLALLALFGCANGVLYIRARSDADKLARLLKKNAQSANTPATQDSA